MLEPSHKSHRAFVMEQRLHLQLELPASHAQSSFVDRSCGEDRTAAVLAAGGVVGE